MELIELENILNACNKSIEENTHINKEMLRKILTNKPERWLNKARIKAGYYILSPLALCLIIVFTNMQFKFDMNFYIGLVLFSIAYFLKYIRDVKYFLLLNRIDLSDKITIIKKNIATLEIYKMQSLTFRNILSPIAIIGALLILFHNKLFTLNSMVFILVVVLVFFVSMYFSRFSVRKQFEILRKEIDEIEALEK